MSYKLFLDDERNPIQCLSYMLSRSNHSNLSFIYKEKDWEICRDFWSFKKCLIEKGLPELVSFDHDLGTDETGNTCAQFLLGYCMDKGLDIPQYVVHSMNPVGTQNIINTLSY